MTKTVGNTVETDSNDPVTLADIERLVGAVLEQRAHFDALLHRIEQQGQAVDARLQAIAAVLDEHAPLLARAKSLMDPGAGVRGFMKRGR